MKYYLKKDINEIHTELWHLLEENTHAKGKAMGLKLTSTLKTYADCTLRKAKKARVSKETVTQSMRITRDCSLTLALHILLVWAIRSIGFLL